MLPHSPHLRGGVFVDEEGVRRLVLVVLALVAMRGIYREVIEGVNVEWTRALGIARQRPGARQVDALARWRSSGRAQQATRPLAFHLHRRLRTVCQSRETPVPSM